ncbi:MAG: BatA and WFA domain-containing protein [Clostridiales bacterium]|nr:BatA and WFA domain-containing protein [Clostridiales bacterium]
MSFYFPLGLLGLIGIPVLILIYIIKSKYTEQTIGSTYLWEISEQFLKKRKPISKLTGIITLILQILAVAASSLLIAHPVFIVPKSANDIYFILDGSASMNIQQGGSTRFKRAQDEINSIIDKSLGGSSYTLVFVRDTADVTFEGITDKEQAKTNVKNLIAGWSSGECTLAMDIAQNYFDANDSAVIYLISDKFYEVRNMTLIDVSANEGNYALNCKPLDNSGTVKGSVVSYKSDATLNIEFSYNYSRDSEYEKVEEVQKQVTKGEAAEFEFEAAMTYYSVRVRITNGDALSADNTVILYKQAAAQSRNVVIVSESNDTLYIRNAIIDAGGVARENVTLISPTQYADRQANGNLDRAELYVFNGYSPATLPTNAAIWLIDGIDGTNTQTGVTFKDYEEPNDTEGPGSYYVPQYVIPSSNQGKKLMENVIQREVAVRKYAVYSAPRFTTILKVGNNPLITVGLNKNNDRQVVFAFKIGDSNFGMLEDFLILTKNLMNYSLPSVIDETVYTCGDVMNVNVVPNCESIVVTSPSGTDTTLDTYGADSCQVKLTETGTYTLRVKRADKEEEILSLFSCVPQSESGSEGGGALSLVGDLKSEYSDGFYDDLLAFFIFIGLLLLADWGIYCYEQHQLR